VETAIPRVEVYEKDEMRPIFVGDFLFFPRPGETISKEMEEGYFNYYKVVEVWHREDGQTGTFQSCVRVQIDD
jgi:hypothetical protein